ncbi:MAG: PilZ domain-containing protein [Desulfuromonadaceae bacterium]|nr:PilZ domain-containing protein [Desulfuromonadaceae bacterium]MDD5105605.1 PilZ domain-containing protein [Desulfuromonadaceae bacterium]
MAEVSQGLTTLLLHQYDIINNVVCGTAENLSLYGMYLRTDHEMPVNISAHVTVSHVNHWLKFDAKVVRREESGAGLQIQGLSATSFACLRD